MLIDWSACFGAWMERGGNSRHLPRPLRPPIPRLYAYHFSFQLNCSDPGSFSASGNSPILYQFSWECLVTEFMQELLVTWVTFYLRALHVAPEDEAR